MKITFSQKATIAMLIMALAIFCACNPYNKLSSHPPISSKDSVKLAAACVATFPTDTSTKIRIDTFYRKGLDSTAYFKALSDSLFGAKSLQNENYITKYKDTCKGALKDLQDHCVTCFNNGYAEGKKQKQIPDTVYYRITKTVTTERTDKIKIAESKQASAEKQAAKYQKKADTYFNLWIAFLVAFLVSLMVNIIQFKTRKA